MSIKEQIEVILKQRNQKAQALKERKAAIQQVKRRLQDSSAELMAIAKTIEDPELKRQYVGVVGSLNTVPAKKALDQLERRLDAGIKRFEREFISIATVGKERQGKSQFLQSVGNLDNRIIPAYSASSCTGATSVIWNTPDMEPGKVRATITFRQPQELLDLVKPYILTLNPDYYEENDLVFEDVGYINLPALSTYVEEGNADQTTALKHLTGIVENFEEIRDLFGASPMTLTDPELIKTLVAQNNGKKPEDPDRENYHKYLAVARADIYSCFFSDVGKLRLVDTVGIGDTKFGIEEAMLTTVDKECDAAIVVTQPISGVQTTDTALYNMLREQFKLRDTGKWLFYLVNHFVGRNDATVGSFKDDVTKGNWAVADCRIVDASNQEKVHNDFVMPMLQTLLANMEQIDGAYLNDLQKYDDLAMGELRKFLADNEALEAVDIHKQMGMEAFLKGKACFSQMTADLSRVVKRWKKEKDKDNGLLWNSVHAIVNDMDQFIPSAETIQTIAEKNGGLLADDVWKVVLHNVRNNITDSFIRIDEVFLEETKIFKDSLVSALYEGLRALSTKKDAAEEEEQDKVAWLKTMMDEVLQGKEQYAQIHKAFDFLYKFEFNTRAQIIQEVRKQLFIINPICDEYAHPSVNFRDENCGAQVHFFLTSRMTVIEDELRYHLTRLCRTPNQAFYAAAEEFYDRLTFASDLKEDELTSMSDVWGQFFQEYSAKLWENDSKRFEVVNQLITVYNAMLKELEIFAGVKEN
ncbi:MAG: hypothetical protein E7437_07380 [Ruminococcaceae bacterium]|nr:hypothetical protein [Oscillospiraceae bacterium]